MTVESGQEASLMLWEEARDIFSRYGIVTPRISRVSSMERISTVIPLDQQIRLVTPAFDKLYLDIFGNINPIRMARPPRLNRSPWRSMS